MSDKKVCFFCAFPLSVEKLRWGKRWTCPRCLKHEIIEVNEKHEYDVQGN